MKKTFDRTTWTMLGLIIALVGCGYLASETKKNKEMPLPPRELTVTFQCDKFGGYIRIKPDTLIIDTIYQLK